MQLLEHLGAKRGKSAKRLHAAVQRHGAAARKRLKRTELKLEKKLCVDGDGSGSSIETQTQATAAALRLDSELRSPKRLTRNNLHSYRLKVKELHNILRMAEDSRQQEFVNALGNIEDTIGEWHDWEELLSIATKVLDHVGRCELLQELKRITNEKYAHALSQAENMRKKYLRVSERQVAVLLSNLPNLCGTPPWL